MVSVAETGFSGGLRELLGLGELDAVGGGLDGRCSRPCGRRRTASAEVGAERGLATGELHGHLTTWGLMVTALSSMVLISSHVSSWTKPTWVGVHEAGVAHHVATVGEVDGRGQSRGRGQTVGTCRGRELLVVVGAGMSRPGKTSSRCLEEGAVSMDIRSLKVAVDGAVLDHQDLAVALDDLCLDLAGTFSAEEDLVGELAVDGSR